MTIENLINALENYDKNKGRKRRLFGDSPGIKDLRTFVAKLDKTNKARRLTFTEQAELAEIILKDDERNKKTKDYFESLTGKTFISLTHELDYYTSFYIKLKEKKFFEDDEIKKFLCSKNTDNVRSSIAAIVDHISLEQFHTLIRSKSIEEFCVLLTHASSTIDALTDLHDDRLFYGRELLYWHELGETVGSVLATTKRLKVDPSIFGRIIDTPQVLCFFTILSKVKFIHLKGRAWRETSFSDFIDHLNGIERALQMGQALNTLFKLADNFQSVVSFIAHAGILLSMDEQENLQLTYASAVISKSCIYTHEFFTWKGRDASIIFDSAAFKENYDRIHIFIDNNRLLKLFKLLNTHNLLTRDNIVSIISCTDSIIAVLDLFDRVYRENLAIKPIIAHLAAYPETCQDLLKQISYPISETIQNAINNSLPRVFSSQKHCERQIAAAKEILPLDKDLLSIVGNYLFFKSQGGFIARRNYVASSIEMDKKEKAMIENFKEKKESLELDNHTIPLAAISMLLSMGVEKTKLGYIVVGPDEPGDSLDHLTQFRARLIAALDKRYIIILLTTLRGRNANLVLLDTALKYIYCVDPRFRGQQQVLAWINDVIQQFHFLECYTIIKPPDHCEPQQKDILDCGIYVAANATGIVLSTEKMQIRRDCGPEEKEILESLYVDVKTGKGIVDKSKHIQAYQRAFYLAYRDYVATVTPEELEEKTAAPPAPTR